MSISRFHYPTAPTIATAVNVSVTMPDGILDGDLIVVAYYTRGTVVNFPAGFVNHGVVPITGYAQSVGIASKQAVAADSLTTKTFGQSASAALGLYPMVYRGSSGPLQTMQFAGAALPDTNSTPTITSPVVSEAGNYTAISAGNNFSTLSGSTIVRPDIDAASDPSWSRLNTTAVASTSRMSVADCQNITGSSPTLIWNKAHATISGYLAVAAITIAESAAVTATGGLSTIRASTIQGSASATPPAVTAYGNTPNVGVSALSGSASVPVDATGSGTLQAVSLSAVSGTADVSIGVTASGQVPRTGVSPLGGTADNGSVPGTATGSLYRVGAYPPLGGSAIGSQDSSTARGVMRHTTASFIDGIAIGSHGADASGAFQAVQLYPFNHVFTSGVVGDASGELAPVAIHPASGAAAVGVKFRGERQPLSLLYSTVRPAISVSYRTVRASIPIRYFPFRLPIALLDPFYVAPVEEIPEPPISLTFDDVFTPEVFV